MWENFKHSANDLWVAGTTFILGLSNHIFSNLPFIHELLGTLSMLLGCIACAIVIVVNYRQARINRLIINEREKINGKL